MSVVKDSSSVTCNGLSDGTASATVSGGLAPYTYLWVDNGLTYTTANATNLPAGTYSFVITDNSNEVNVSFVGIIPNLFAENKGVVVEGLAIDNVNFTALKVLAKHDENYMPPEVIEALKQEGQWQEE